MNSKSILLSFLTTCLISSMAFSQSVLVPKWSLIESSAITNGNAEAWAIGSDKSGNLIWGVNKDAPGFFEYMNAFVYKLDKDKNLIWMDTSITGQFAQQSYNLKVTDSLIYVGGRTCRALGIDSCDVLFFNTDLATGKTGWDFVWDGGYGYEEIDGIALDDDGIYITGWTTGNGSEYDVLLMKINYSGNLIWKKTMGSNPNRGDHQDGHIVVDDSIIYISGLYDGSPGLGWQGRALLAKYDKNNGDLVDSFTYGRQDAWVNAENALGMTSDGTHLYVTGYTTVEMNNWDIFVAKFDKNLNQVWYTTWGGASTESARGIAVAPDGSIYVGGNTESYGQGGLDLALLKFNPSGILEWYKTWGEKEDDQSLDIYMNEDGLYLTGKTQSFHPNKKWDALLLKVEHDSLVSIDDVSINNLNLIISPNPMNSFATLNFSNPLNAPHKLVIYNNLGQVVKTIRAITSEEVILEKKDLSKGVFYFQLSNEIGEYAKGKLIIN